MTTYIDEKQSSRRQDIQNNVFKGPRSLHDYYDPDLCPPLPLVELPKELNPYLESHGVRIYAKMMSVLPATNVKSLPALNMLLEGGLDVKKVNAGGQSTPPLDPADRKGLRPHTIVEYSSGSTAISLGILARIMGVESAQTYISNKTSAAKLALLRFFGLELTLFGGPSQPEPEDERGGIRAANRLGEKEGFYNPDQYSNTANYRAHQRWTGPQLLKQLPEVSLVAAGMGTAGTMTGIGLSIKAQKPEIYRLGVCTATGDRVPGPRTEPLLAPVTFPWREAVDEIEHVTSADAYRHSLSLCRHGLLAGPSSGLTLMGVFQHLDKRIANGSLDEIRDPATGNVNCIFICCDLPYQYVSEYFDKLGEAHFKPIHNDVLIGSDKHRYDEAWELTRNEAQELCRKVGSEIKVVDLRGPQKACQVFEDCAVQALDLDCLKDGESRCPFSDAHVLHQQWSSIEATLDDEENKFWRPSSSDGEVLVLCANGNTARVATSCMRARGIQAFSLFGGLDRDA